MEKQVAHRLVQQYGTNEPFQIIEAMGIIQLFENLGLDTWGYYTNIFRIPCIHINSLIEDFRQRYAAAHELGHHIIHKGISTPFLRENTLQSIDKIERQANQFAVELLMPDRLLLEGLTLYEAATFCGVPHEIAHLKQVMKPMKQNF